MGPVRVAMVVAFALAVGACAGSTVDEAEPASPTTVPTSTPTPRPPTPPAPTPPAPPPPQSAKGPPQDFACPRPLDPIASADMDGDGVDETLSIEAVGGGQQLVVCGDGLWQALPLELGAWYLAVFEPESGGADDVFLGRPDVDDLPAAPRASLVWFDPEQSQLQPDRRLWLDGSSEPAGLVDLVRVPPPASICDEGDVSLEADIDGDGLLDKVIRRQLRSSAIFTGGPTITVCTAAGVTDEVIVAGTGEMFVMSSGTGDRPTIWSGGITTSAGFFDPFVFVDERILPLRADGARMLFSDGWKGPDARSQFACADLTGDGVLELVQLDGVRDGDEVVWTRRSWETEADRAELVTETTLRLPWPTPADGEQPDEPPSEFGGLAASWGRCSWLTP